MLFAGLAPDMRRLLQRQFSPFFIADKKSRYLLTIGAKRDIIIKAEGRRQVRPIVLIGGASIIYRSPFLTVFSSNSMSNSPNFRKNNRDIS